MRYLRLCWHVQPLICRELLVRFDIDVPSASLIASCLLMALESTGTVVFGWHPSLGVCHGLPCGVYIKPDLITL